MPFSLCQPNRYRNDESNLIVLLDIDHTMMETIHFPSQEAADKYVAKLPTAQRMDSNNPQKEEPVFFFQQRSDNGSIMHFNFRPGLFKFLRALSRTCQLHIYTAGQQAYAEYVANVLDRNYFSKDRIWSRDGGRVSICHGKWHWKDVKKLPLGRNGNLSRVVLIDDNVQTLLANPTNVYPVSKFYNDPNDNELHKALEYFNSKLIHCKDIRQVLWETNKDTVANLMEFHARDTFMFQEPFTTWKEFLMKQEKKHHGLARNNLLIVNPTSSNHEEGREAMAPITIAAVNSADAYDSYLL